MKNQQEKEIASMKERLVKLNLSDADCERLAKKAGKVNMTVGELLENFIGDLVDGTYSNGSDERMLAEEWYERSVAMAPESTLLRHLLDLGEDVDDFLTVYDEMKLYEENPEEYERELKENKVPVTLPWWFHEEYQAYTKEFIEEQGGTVDMEGEVLLIRKWHVESLALGGEK